MAQLAWNLKPKLSLLLAGAVLFPSSACVTRRAMDNALRNSEVSRPPAPVGRQIDKSLACFGEMAAAYTLPRRGDQPYMIEIEFLGNELDKELPADLGAFARTAIERIGGLFSTVRTWQAVPPTARLWASPIPQTPEPPRSPAPAFRLVGSLLGASDRVAASAGPRTDVTFGKNHGQTDGSASGNAQNRIAALTFNVTLEGLDHRAVPNTTTMVRIFVEKHELNRSFSVYVNGSGLGIDSRTSVNEDHGDAIYDAIALTAIHSLGVAIGLPYFRCNPLFPPDPAFESAVRKSLSISTQAELELTAKRYLSTDGFAVDGQARALTDTDRAILRIEKRRHGIQAEDHAAWAEFLFQLWRDLDFQNGARRESERYNRTILAERENQEKADRERAALTVSAEEFGWAASTNLVILDLSLFRDGSSRDLILAALRACSACVEARAHPTKSVWGIKLSNSQRSDVQRALRASSLRLEFEWFNSVPPRLLIAPGK